MGNIISRGGTYEALNEIKAYSTSLECVFLGDKDCQLKQVMLVEEKEGVDLLLQDNGKLNYWIWLNT